MRKFRMAAAICVVLAVVLAAVGIYKYMQESRAGEDYDIIRKEAGRLKPTTDVPLEQTDEAVPETETGEASEIVIPVDFEALQKNNPDIYAWIHIPGTSVDYPIVQRPKDNSYYLDHSVTGEKKPEGAIFTENYNTKTFEDPNTVIYGHRMTNDSMFNSLHNYTDRSFFDENRDVHIYMPDKILNYRIFAAYLYDNRHLLMSFNFWNKEDFGDYLKAIFSMRRMDAFIDTSMEVTAEDTIITLSTCYAGKHDQRYLVQAVLVSIEKP